MAAFLDVPTGSNAGNRALVRGAVLLVIAMIGGILANVAEGPWAITGAIASVCVLLLYILVELFKPILRRRTLRNPAIVHFTCRNSKQSLSGRDVSEGDPHWMRALVLRANSIERFEIGLKFKANVYVEAMVIGCAGNLQEKPFIVANVDRSAEHGRRDASLFFQMPIKRTFNVGTHYVWRLEIETRSPGRYPVNVSFITDEVEGNFDGLEIIVEETPATLMRCHKTKPKHGKNCLVSPVDLS